MSTYITIPLPTNFAERQRTHSAAIKHKDEAQFPDRYGVIFTYSDDPREDDFDVSILEGALAINMGGEDKFTEEERTFTIIGGYFFERIASGQAKTTKVFGIVSDTSKGFNITEGGGTIIHDDWMLTDGKKRRIGINELYDKDKGDTNPPTIGWTFIVAEAKEPDTKYPKTACPIALKRECATILDITERQTRITKNKQSFQYEASYEGPKPDNFHWEFGKGGPTKTTKEPKVSNSFDRPFGADESITIYLNADGASGLCKASFTKESTIKKTCPAITKINHIETDKTAETQTYAFSLEGSLLDSPEIEFEWDFGEKEPTTTSIPSAAHSFFRPEGDDSVISVSVTAKGPESCQTTMSIDIPLEGICPVFEELKVEEGTSTKGKKIYTFEAQTSGPIPTSYEWDFGDGHQQTSTTPSVSHEYDRPEHAPETYTVTVSVFGPGEQKCQTGGKKEIIVPTKCPEISRIGSIMGSQTDIETTYDFDLEVVGTQPDTYHWDFGDGTTQIITNKEISHTFIRPQDADKSYTVRVQTSGPGTCEGGAETTVEIHVQCPKISQLLHTRETKTSTEYTVSFSAQINGTSPNRYIWDFGDGITVNSDDPDIQHTYERPFGSKKTYQVFLTIEGPRSCRDESSIYVEVPGRCPDLVDIQIDSGKPIGDYQPFDFKAIVQGGNPGSYTWDFGDGKVTNQFGETAIHRYKRPKGADKRYKVTARIQGPADCDDSHTVEVVVKGICPEILEVQKRSKELSQTQFEVAFSAVVQGVAPTSFEWNFGDETDPVTTNGPTVTHTFERPDGPSETYTVSVRSSGPGECVSTKSTVCSVPGECPVVVDVLKENERLTETSITLDLTAVIEPIGTNPEKYFWDFGDGSPIEETTIATVSHTYSRSQESTLVLIHVRTEGPIPGSGLQACQSRTETEILIPKIGCPMLVAINVERGIPTETHQPYTFVAEVEGKNEPSLYIWDFGDGSKIQKTNTKSISHNYERIVGQKSEHTVQLQTQGPSTCQSSLDTKVIVEALCPILTTVDVQTDLTPDSYIVTLTPQVSGPTPSGYQVEWGDGKFRPQVISPPPFVNEYERLPGEEQFFRIRVDAMGPGSCQSYWEEEITVPAICPKILSIEQTVVKQTEINHAIRFDISYEGPKPDWFILGLGRLAAPILSKEPSIQFNFNRIAGLDQEIAGKVLLQGPKKCKDDQDITINIPKVCPELTGIKHEIIATSKTEQRVKFTVQSAGYPPERYEWNFGDGKGSFPSKSSSYTHVFERPEGADRTYHVQVQGIGPKECITQTEIDISIIARCPEINEIIQEIQEPTKHHVEVIFTADVGTPSPIEYIWDFGDGSDPETHSSTRVSHTYERPIGDDVPFTVQLTTRGPRECERTAETTCIIKGRCPVFQRIDAELDSTTSKIQKYRFKAIYENIVPEGFLWVFGDGSGKRITEKPEIEHVFKRPFGEAITYTVQLWGQGPGSCETSGEKEIEILEICPEITGITKEPQAPLLKHISVNFTAQLNGPHPDEYKWDFGDGSPIRSSSSPSISHRYNRPVGSDRSYRISVTAVGPKKCRAGSETEILIIAQCPELRGILTEAQAPTETQMEVHFSADVGLPRPKEFIWDFGDGSAPKSTTEPSIIHIYDRPIGDAVTYSIKLTTQGPGDCTSSAQVTCPVPGRCPELIGIQTDLEVPTSKAQKIRFTALSGEIKPQTYLWIFGDGSGKRVSTDPFIDHIFLRPVGEPETYTVSVQGQGPGNCRSASETEVTIEKICPELRGIEAKPQKPTDTAVVVHFKALLQGPHPSEYRWNFGDGSPISTSASADITHTFTRPAGDAETYTIVVEAVGPKSCHTSASVDCPIPGVCPDIQEVDIQTEVYPDTYEVILTPSIKGPAPNNYSVDWGEGQFDPEMRGLPPFKHIYDRPIGEDDTKKIAIKAYGPDSCETSWGGHVEIPGKCPVIKTVKQEIVKQTDFVHGIRFTIEYEGPKPDQFILNFGMIAPPVISEDPIIFQNFNRYNGIEQTLHGKAIIQGPKGCNFEYEVEVNVPKSCPRLSNLQKEIEESTRESQLILFTAIQEGYPPDKYIWDLGDGSKPIETKANTYSHRYSRLSGEDKVYDVMVTAVGPKECETKQPAQVEIPGKCPLITKFQLVEETYYDTKKVVAFQLHFEDIAGTSFEWDWGDGKTETTSTPSASHEYPILAGDTKQYQVQVSVVGPGACVSVATETVAVPGVCPTISKILTSAQAPKDNKQLVKVSLESQGPKANSYTWNWGDGSPVTITEKPESEHEYEQKPGNDKSYSIIVNASGPDSCMSGCTEVVEIPGLCPSITSFVPTIHEPSKESQVVEVVVEIDGPSPDAYIWTWGDGTTETTKSPSASHSYERLPGDDTTYTIELELDGPEGCGCEISEEVRIKGICPKITFLQHLPVSKDRSKARVQFDAMIEGPKPTTYTWNVEGWEKPITTKTPTLLHDFERPPGEDKTYKVEAVFNGPGSCCDTEEVSVTIEKICPLIDQISSKADWPEEETQRVTVTVKVLSPMPDRLTWEWGDGTEDSMIETGGEYQEEWQFSHVYTRPKQEDQPYTVIVTSDGPSDCQCYATTQVIIPVVCPKVTDIKPTYGKLTEETQSVTYRLNIEGNEDIEYEWDWGDGTASHIGNTTEVTHDYRRKGPDTTYTTTVYLRGPNQCRSEVCVAVNIPGTCPRIIDVRTNYGQWDEVCQQIKFRASTERGNHSSYRWDWGDGSPIETTDTNIASHTFMKSGKETSTYSVVVTGIGPVPESDKECEACESQKTIDVAIPGNCPIVVNIKSIKGETTSTKQTYTFAAITRGPVPNKYIWDIHGSLNGKETDDPNLTYTFDRAQSADREHEITLTLLGPGNDKNCMEDYTTTIEIAKADP